MEKKLLELIKSLESSTGELFSRRMFGGTGVFSNNVMFAIIDRDSLHLRASEEQCKLFDKLGYERFKCRNYSVSISSFYYSMGEDVIENQDLLLQHVQESINAAIACQAEKDKIASERLKNLPNLTSSTERLLHKAGINNVSELIEVGAAYAFDAIQRFANKDVGIKLMWNIEGAINKVHWSVVSKACRDELFEEYQSIINDNPLPIAA